jgi:C-terminal processing protease CtpA/Prc
MNLLARHQDPQVTFVSRVEMKGLAKQAGILVGDEILSIGGKPAESYEGTVALMKGMKNPNSNPYP